MSRGTWWSAARRGPAAAPWRARAAGAGWRWSRRSSCPKLKVCGCCAGSAASSCVPATTRTGTPLGSVRSTATPPMALRQRAGRRSRSRRRAAATSASSCGPERGAEEPRPRSAAHDHARRAGVGAAQLQLVGGAQHGGEAERAGERLGADQVRLLELQPGQVVHLDHRVARPPGVLAAQRALLAVQVVVGVDVCRSRASPRLTDDIVTYRRPAQSRVSDEILNTDDFC